MNDAEALDLIEAATRELGLLGPQIDALFERVRPALVWSAGVFHELDSGGELDEAKVQPFLDASGLTAFWALTNAYADGLRRADNLSWLLFDD